MVDDDDISLKSGSQKKNQNLLEDLESILANHGMPVNEAYQPSIDDTEKKEEKKELKFHKISLFDDEI